MSELNGQAMVKHRSEALKHGLCFVQSLSVLPCSVVHAGHCGSPHLLCSLDSRTNSAPCLLSPLFPSPTQELRDSHSQGCVESPWKEG